MKTYQLPKEFAEKWVAALRATPEERHTVGVYYKPSIDCYCGMGLGYFANGYEFTKSGNSLINEEADFFDKVKPMAGDKKDPSLWDIFWNLNDRERLTFAEQADWIESNVEFI